MNPKGIVQIVVIAIVLLALILGAGSYLYISKQNEETLQEPGLNESLETTPVAQNKNEGIPQIADAGNEEDEPTIESQEVLPPASEPSDTQEPIFSPPVAETPAPQGSCSRVFSPKYGTGPYYTGPLFDAHFHMPNVIDYSTIDQSSVEGHTNEFQRHGGGTAAERDAEIDKILCVFGKEKTRGAVGFVMGDQIILNETIEGIKAVRQKASEIMHIFLSPVGFSAAALETIQTSNGGLLEGYGELSFGFGGGLQSNQSPDDQNFLDVYKVAGENNLVMMIHVGAQQESKIENILQKNPNVKFLFHGPESENFIHNIIGKYPNAYYSIDAMLIRLPGAPGALMYMVSGKNEFETKFAQNYSTVLNNAVNQWKSKIEQYPDRYMWGTDRYNPWTYNEDISALIEEFARDFIGELSPAAQENFAYKNAEKLLGK